MNNFRKILITKSEEETRGIFTDLVKLNFELKFFPTIKMELITPSKIEIDQIKKLEDHSVLVFTSANAVKFFFRILEKYDINFDFGKYLVAATGSATADECYTRNINVSIIPDIYSAEGLLDKFSEYGISGLKVLIPGSKLMGNTLQEGIKKLKGFPIKIVTYDVVIPTYDSLSEELNHGQISSFVFTSPSSFRNYLTIMKVKDASKYFYQKDVYAIGATTEKEIKRNGIENVFTPREYTLGGVRKLIELNNDIEIAG